ncbi:magnesium-dependent phosphatase-1 [Pelagophyceae sp. CCMP2097]|nr:magnesium-dependent phosphatase-1 [Pelagophyceae sp. CCMP2097]
MRNSAMAPARPKVYVFDLDNCCWLPEMYQLWGGGGAPFTGPDAKNELRDVAGTRVHLLGNVAEIWGKLHADNEIVAVASRSDEPTWARECLKKFKVDAAGTSMMDVVTEGRCEIYKGSKVIHLRKIAEKTNVALEDMVFFDDDAQNIRDVAAIGVTSIFTPDGEGVTFEALEKARAAFAQKHTP